MVARATGANYPAVSDTTVKQSRLPLPPLPEQRRIAAILDKAERLRRRAGETCTIAERFPWAVFLDFFGDPVTNVRKWPTRPLGTLGTIVIGNTPPRAHPEFYGGDLEWIKSDNIDAGSYVVGSAKETLSPLGAAHARIAPSSAILITCIAGSRRHIGDAAMTDRTVAFNQQIAAVIPATDIDATFLFSALRLSRRLVQAASTDSMKGMVSKSRLAKIRVPVPPYSTQLRFRQVFLASAAANRCLGELSSHITTLATGLADSFLSRTIRSGRKGLQE
jgi:type I restriction enzyme S subunit